MRPSKGRMVSQSARRSGAMLFAAALCAFACGDRPPVASPSSSPRTDDASDAAPAAPSPVVAEPAFVPPVSGLYDVEAEVLADSCWTSKPTKLTGTRFVEVNEHQGKTFVYPHLDDMPDLGFVTGPFAMPPVGKEHVQAYPPHVLCPKFTKRQSVRTIASERETFTLERTADTGDAAGCPALFTIGMPENCHHVTRYVYTLRKTPPQSVVNAPATPPPCEKPRRGKRGPFAQPTVEVQLRARIPYEPEAERCLDRIAPGMWARIERQFPGITLTPLFEDPEGIERMANEVRQRGETPPDLLVIFRVDRPASVDPNRLAAALRAEPIVEWAEVSHKAVPASR